MKTGYFNNIEKATLANENFRQVLYTGEHLQLVLMTLKPGEEIGLEVHSDTDQFFRFESGQGKVVVNETEYQVGDGDVVIVPAGAKHNVINMSDSSTLTMYTIYTPPHHKDSTIHITKAEAEGDHEHFAGETSE